MPGGSPPEGGLYAYNAQNGKQFWRQKIEDTMGVPAVDNGVVYVSTNIVGTQTYKVMALGAGDGKQRWQHQIVSGDMPTPYEVNGIVYVVGAFLDRKVYALNAGDGSLVWTLNLGLAPV